MALPTETSEGDRLGLAPPVSFVRKGGKRVGDVGRATIGRRHNLGTFDLIWSIRPSGKSAKNWNRTPVGNDR